MTDTPPVPGTAGSDPTPDQHPDPRPDVPGTTDPAPRPVPDTPSDPKPTPEPDLPPAAQRALAEAEERRRTAKALELPTELGGRDGPEPVRYGDWEKKGLAIDF